MNSRVYDVHPVACATGLAWPEGPAALPDGRVVFVETYRSCISYWELGGKTGRFADTGGGPNATCLGSDDRLYVTQNGGIVGPWRAADQRPPSIQRVSMEGRVEIVATQIEGIRFQAPNDLAFGADGRLYFTDPGRFDMETRPDPGYIFALDPDGSGEVVAETGHTYPNGIVAEANGSVVWVESYTRAVQRWHQSHGVTEVCILEGETHLPDGLKVAANGDLYITTTGSGGLDVVAPDGSYVGFIPVGSVPTNCAFRGTTLYVTDGGQPGIGDASYQGILWAVEVPVQGVQPFRGAIS